MVGAMTESRPYDTALGYLRSFVTVLVVAHHAMLAYHPFAPPPPDQLAGPGQWWRAFPVVDVDRWSGFLWPVSWNDTFFMSLMFLLSGLFVWPSLSRKGSGRYLRERVVRLGVPWLIAVVVLSPLAYYPTFLQSGGHGLAAFARQWCAAGDWPSGPAWFLAVLLGFDVVASGLCALGRGWARLPRHPLGLFAAVLALSAIAYVPLTLVIDSSRWSSIGPLSIQTGRALHYAVYFFVGVALGAAGARDAVTTRLARGWWAWCVLAAAAFYALVQAFMRAMMTGAAPGSIWGLASSLGFVVTCAASCFAMLALFARFARPNRVFDHLRDNAYTIYVIHYAIVAWLQYALLDAALSGLTKGVIAIAGGLAVSWALSAVIRGATARGATATAATA